MRGVALLVGIVVLALVLGTLWEVARPQLTLMGVSATPTPRPAPTATPDAALLKRWYTDRVNALSVARQFNTDYPFNEIGGRGSVWLEPVIGLGKASDRLTVLTQETAPAGTPAEMAVRFNAIADAYRTASTRYHEAANMNDSTQRAGTITLGHEARNRAEGLGADWLREAAAWLNSH